MPCDQAEKEKEGWGWGGGVTRVRDHPHNCRQAERSGVTRRWALIAAPDGAPAAGSTSAFRSYFGPSETEEQRK